MPYRWTPSLADASAADPHERQGSRPETTIELHLWPHRSLPRKGFVWVIAITAIGLALPLLSVIGSGVMWGLLPFAALVIWALWVAIERSYRSGATHEVLTLTPDQLTLRRQDPGRSDRLWQANPYWVRTRMHHHGPVENYLTLTDGQREYEIGSFLAPEERETLRRELEQALARVHQPLG